MTKMFKCIYCEKDYSGNHNCECPVYKEKNLNQHKNNLTWHKSTEELPKIGINVIGFNKTKCNIEFGLRSSLDGDPESWIDFDFPVTHWAYANSPGDMI